MSTRIVPDNECNAQNLPEYVFSLMINYRKTKMISLSYDVMASLLQIKIH